MKQLCKILFKGGEFVQNLAINKTSDIKVISLKLFYYQTFFETWHNEHS